MTTIAYDGKILAADTQITCDGRFVAGYGYKIHKLSDGSHIAFAGSMNCMPAMIDWFETGKEPDFKDASFECLHIATDGTAHDYYSNLNKGYAVIPWVGGSGAQIALAALSCGKNAIEAVELASKLDIMTGGEIQSVEINVI